MNGVISWWAKNPVAANLLMIGIILAGLLSFLRMEREVFPAIRVNWVEVTVAWPGAAPQEVEEQIVIRLEEAMEGLDNVKRIRSIAGEGSARMYIEADRSVNMDRFLNEAKLRVDSISTLPGATEPPRIRELVTRSEMLRVAVHGDVGEHLLKDTAERVRTELMQKPGISIVELFGARREEVSVELSETAMQRYGLTFDDVATAIRGSSLNLSSGSVRSSTGDIQLRASNLADTAADFERIVLRQTDGGVIRLGDVARVVDGFEDVEIQATMNGEPAILVQVMSMENMNIVRMAESVRAYLAEGPDGMPEGVSLTLYQDESKVYYDRMETIGSSAFFGLLLVCGVLLLTLRPKVAVWVTVGIATAFAGAFIFLPANDVSLNFLSLFAFLLVIGVVVDDAIVVGENIHTESTRTGGGVDAAILGAQLVAKPVVYAVMTTMIVFAPWLFLSGAEVEFTRHISIIVIAALTFSLIEALFILPAHLSTMTPRRNMGRFARFQKGIADALTHFARTRYRAALTAALSRRGVTVSIFAAAFILSVGVVSSGWLKFNFMPDVESEQISVDVTLPEGTPFSRAQQVLAQLQAAETELEAEVNARADAGEGSGELVENWYTRARPTSVLALVRLAPPEVRDMSAKAAAERLRTLIGEIPDAETIEVNFTLNQGGPDIEFAVNHPDLDVLRTAVADLSAKLASYETVVLVQDDLQSAMKEIRLALKPDAHELGLTLSDVSRQLRQAYYGEEVQRLPRGGDDVKVMVRYPEEARRSLESLEDFRLRMPDGRQIPLSAVAEISYEPSLRVINRRAGQRSAEVEAELAGDAVREPIMQDLKANFFPGWEQRYPGVSRGMIGQAEGEAEFMAEILSLETIALFVMYALIAIAFRSYAMPLLVMTAIPFGFMGAIVGHLVFGMSMTLYSYFGIAAAAGVVVNDNLVLVDYVNRMRERGMGVLEALIESGINRFRPILLTSVTTFVGLMPMMMERSTQAQFLKPTVVSLAFGVALATFVTLFLVPSMYALGEDFRRFMKQLWTGERQPKLGEATAQKAQPAE